MTALTQETIDKIRTMPQERVAKVRNFILMIEQEDRENTEYLAKIDRGIAEKIAGQLQYHDLIEADA